MNCAREDQTCLARRMRLTGSHEIDLSNFVAYLVLVLAAVTSAQLARAQTLIVGGKNFTEQPKPSCTIR
jgi:hypothetical protein